MYTVNEDWTSPSTYYLEYGRHVGRLHRRRRRANVLTSNTAVYDNHEKIHTWVSFPYMFMGLHLAAPRPSGRRSSAITWSMAAILRDSVVVVVVVRTRLRAIPLAMITTTKFIDGFPFLSHMSMGLRFGPPELRYHTSRTICYVSKAWGVAHQTSISLGTVVSWRSYRLEI